MNDTPRTDAEVARLGGLDEWGERWMPHTFAQSIESDLMQVQRQLERANALIEHLRLEASRGQSAIEAARALKWCIESFSFGIVINPDPGCMIPSWLKMEIGRLRENVGRIWTTGDGVWVVEEPKP
jgi:hypothetical protein